MTSLLLSTRQLCCERGDRLLFEGLDLAISAGELLYIEGHNGSGKTSLLRTLAGLLAPSEGDVLWQGTKVHKVADEFRSELLYLGHLNGVKLDLSPLENLQFNCRLKNEPVSRGQLESALETIGLLGFEDVPARHLSQGQKRRIALAQLLVSKTRLWILDEPFVALDIAAVAQLQQVIQTQLERGGAVMLTTHQEVPLTSGQVSRLTLGARHD